MLLLVEKIQSVIGADPKMTAIAIDDRPDIIIAEAFFIGRIIRVDGKKSLCCFESVQSIVCTDPENSRFIR